MLTCRANGCKFAFVLLLPCGMQQEQLQNIKIINIYKRFDICFMVLARTITFRIYRQINFAID